MSDSDSTNGCHKVLTLDQVPFPEDDWETISEFALTFDGYSYWGSFEKCAAIGNARSQNSLIELRTCLFFEQRRHHHFGEAPDRETMAYIRELIAKIRTKLEFGESA